MIDSYHTRMTRVETWPVSHTEVAQKPFKEQTEVLPVTEEEEEAWLNKLRDLAGVTA